MAGIKEHLKQLKLNYQQYQGKILFAISFVATEGVLTYERIQPVTSFRLDTSQAALSQFKSKLLKEGIQTTIKKGVIQIIENSYVAPTTTSGGKDLNEVFVGSIVYLEVHLKRI
jgi:hypothetical protein